MFQNRKWMGWKEFKNISTNITFVLSFWTYWEWNIISFPLSLPLSLTRQCLFSLYFFQNVGVSLVGVGRAVDGSKWCERDSQFSTSLLSLSHFHSSWFFSTIVEYWKNSGAWRQKWEIGERRRGRKWRLQEFGFRICSKKHSSELLGLLKHSLNRDSPWRKCLCPCVCALAANRENFVQSPVLSLDVGSQQNAH